MEGRWHSIVHEYYTVHDLLSLAAKAQVLPYPNYSRPHHLENNLPPYMVVWSCFEGEASEYHEASGRSDTRFLLSYDGNRPVYLFKPILQRLFYVKTNRYWLLIDFMHSIVS